MREELTNPLIQKLIRRGLKKSIFDEITDEDIKKLEEIELIQSFMDGKSTNIKISDIRFFPNLVKLNLVGYEVTTEDMEMIAKLDALDFIGFDSCSFDDINFEDFARLPQLMCFLRCVNLPENYWSSGSVYFKMMKVDFNQIPFEKIRKIRLDNCTIVNAHDIEDYPNLEEIILDSCIFLDAEGQEIREIKVPKNTKYIHTCKEPYPVMNNEIREESIR